MLSFIIARLNHDGDECSRQIFLDGIKVNRWIPMEIVLDLPQLPRIGADKENPRSNYDLAGLLLPVYTFEYDEKWDRR